MKHSITIQWKFIDQHGTFELDDPKAVTCYLPLVNQAGMISVRHAQPFNGDAKTGPEHIPASAGLGGRPA